ncbi:hypothetical protein N8I77_003747 [Diaporthe amygdali]|uniref:Apple domain-containing protein n=1 Tax=Phomopsis amygdali TaxID=1214568 RepID=A0AAD9W7Z2_PHOAM|nr:hypothetical protein N8I77_003747 [Diaporthe amygdali]
MAAQYQPAQGQYYQPQQAVEKGHTMGGAPQNMGYNPNQQQFTNGNGYNPTGYGYAPQASGYAQPAPSAPASSGVKRSTCFAIFVALLILLAAVIGLSAGLGVSQRNLRNAKADLARATESPSAATTVYVTAKPTSTGTPTATSSSASASATPDTSNITCPGSNNTLYTSDADSKQFEQYCGIDFSGDQAIDVGNVKVTSMDACMDACASQSNCTGAGWGYLEGDNGTEHSCWMKANLTEPHNATSEWAFAILLNVSQPTSQKQKRRSSWWF